MERITTVVFWGVDKKEEGEEVVGVEEVDEVVEWDGVETSFRLEKVVLPGDDVDGVEGEEGVCVGGGSSGEGVELRIFEIRRVEVRRLDVRSVELVVDDRNVDDVFAELLDSDVELGVCRVVEEVFSVDDPIPDPEAVVLVVLLNKLNSASVLNVTVLDILGPIVVVGVDTFSCSLTLLQKAVARSVWTGNRIVEFSTVAYRINKCRRLGSVSSFATPLQKGTAVVLDR